MKKLLALLLALCMVLGLAACGSSSSGDEAADTAETEETVEVEETAETEEEAEPEAEEAEAKATEYEEVTVRVAYMPNMGSAATLFVAIDQGYFEQFGLNVEVYEFEGGPAEIAAMASGDIDISQIGHGAHALCIEGNAVIFAMDHTTSLSDCVLANVDHGITTAADLAGKTIAVQSGTSSEIILQQVLYSAGLTEDDVELVEMTVDVMTTAMISGQVDACAIWSPNSVTVQTQLGDSCINLGGNADFLDSAIFPSSYITTAEYAEENADVLVRFGAALNLAHEWRAANIEETAINLAHHLDVDEDTMLECLEEADWYTILDVCGDMDAIKTVYETQQSVFIANGRITETVDTEEYVLYDIMQDAYDLFVSVS
ncbi:MAG: ABC transporter substrate-binding protein [Oscillospiraceae bacterium]|nr:ABC transporter substrate-binding protein [Oscillospiraceae bacterium]